MSTQATTWLQQFQSPAMQACLAGLDRQQADFFEQVQSSGDFVVTAFTLDETPLIVGGSEGWRKALRFYEETNYPRPIVPVLRVLQEKQSEGRFHWSGMKYLRNATDNIFAFDERPHIFHGPYFAPSNVLTIASLLMLPNQTGITLEPVPREISVQAVRDLLGERKWPLYLGSQPVDIHGDREVLPYLAAMHDIIHYLCWQDRDADYLEDALAYYDFLKGVIEKEGDSYPREKPQYEIALDRILSGAVTFSVLFRRLWENLPGDIFYPFLEKVRQRLESSVKPGHHELLQELPASFW